MFRREPASRKKTGATPERCHLFDSAGKAFQRKIVEVLAA
jgi:multiple sugar transport system ATP-binding protein